MSITIIRGTQCILYIDDYCSISWALTNSAKLALCVLVYPQDDDQWYKVRPLTINYDDLVCEPILWRNNRDARPKLRNVVTFRIFPKQCGRIEIRRKAYKGQNDNESPICFVTHWEHPWLCPSHSHIVHIYLYSVNIYSSTYVCSQLLLCCEIFIYSIYIPYGTGSYALTLCFTSLFWVTPRECH